MRKFNELSISSSDDLIFGKSPCPITLKNGLVIGGGDVYPEINFTLDSMVINSETMPLVLDQYSQMIEGVCNRAVDLHAPGLVVELELLPDLTLVPERGARVTALLKKVLRETEEKSGIRTVLRVTPNDIREFARPPIMRSGEFVENMFRSFEYCGREGADFLAIESTGGKEIHDEAILTGDLPMSVFALGILASRDMAFLWEKIIQICKQTDSLPSGDSACGFANTAMVLAEQKYIPRVWAAVIRVLTVARSLVAFEQGAVGPNKDCAYEGPFIKAITGCPITLEGAEAACAHLSPIGNIARATPDLWSNESVQNIKLLSGMAPTVSLEQLIYSCRLMNQAVKSGRDTALSLRNLFVESDCGLDPQAYILRPDVVVDLSRKIISQPTSYLRTRTAALETLSCLRKATDEKAFEISKLETRWLDKLSRQADTLPEDEEAFISDMIPKVDPSKVVLSEYLISGK
jgi:methanol--5-hydroxybenzimidazolylcobamide Co-methyltransferase